MELKENITQWIAPYLEEHDLFLVDIKIQGGKKVEVYVDSDTGIAVGQMCRYIAPTRKPSRWLGYALRKLHPRCVFAWHEQSARSASPIQT
jgi:hypothetical protein